VSQGCVSATAMEIVPQQNPATRNAAPTGSIPLP
jgi:hypothetical protein